MRRLILSLVVAITCGLDFGFLRTAPTVTDAGGVRAKRRRRRWDQSRLQAGWERHVFRSRRRLVNGSQSDGEVENEGEVGRKPIDPLSLNGNTLTITQDTESPPPNPPTATLVYTKAR
jgi:hypothetical protein